MRAIISELRSTGSTVTLSQAGTIDIEWASELPESQREEFREIIRKNKPAIIEALRAEPSESIEQTQDQEPDDPARRHYMEPGAFLAELRANGGSLTIKPDGQPWISFAGDTPREIKDRLTLVYAYHQAAIIEALKKEPTPTPAPPPPQEDPIPLDSPEEMRLRESSEYRELRANLLTHWHSYGRTPIIDEAFRRYPKHTKAAVRAAIEDMALVCPDCARRLEIGACTHRKPELAWFDFKLNRDELRLWATAALPWPRRPLTPQDIEAVCERGEKEKGFLPVVTRRAIAQILREEQEEQKVNQS
ncbi:hypothetical protein [Methylacidimicrobium tartarophylax]|uniref:Uncharacterized protein n=1 Tax=Methylacidimicrobium tartarophylax TaxID=1041768 RepID=A0A5E6MQ08_9BACT|nr:hypothetical protein [Methylacidimicrobium tartarophylax]VVM07590.1 hypothetical protein MAMT_01816 [Methylacidimicrobium tartarophylax]